MGGVCLSLKIDVGSGEQKVRCWDTLIYSKCDCSFDMVCHALFAQSGSLQADLATSSMVLSEFDLSYSFVDTYASKGHFETG